MGVVRVSERGGREGDSFASPGEQRDRIVAACERDGWQLLEAIEEMDVSGGTPLAQRHGLRRAVETIEAHEADVLIVAYFDRLVRSIIVQAEVVSRVEAAGGRVLALDFGEVTNDTAAQWLSGTMLGAVSEYHRRSVKERTGEAQARAVARGVPPWPNVTPGYRRGEDGRYVPDVTAPVIGEAFAMRAAGARVADVRSFLAENGVDRSYHGVCFLLASRVVLGEIRFGKHVNLTAHPAIVPVDVWQAVQNVKIPRGRAAKSPRLLARLGVLRCGTCGSLMVVGAQNRWPFYRCNRVREDCPRRVTISAPLAESVVVEAVRSALADIEGRASVESNAREAESALEVAQGALDAAVRTLEVLGDELSARAKLLELRATRDEARARVEQLGGERAAVVVNAARDWDRLTVAEQRALIRATVERAVVAPGRGPGRIRVDLFGQ